MRLLHGISLKTASVLVFISIVAMIKSTAAHVPPGQAKFFRSLFAISVIVARLAWRRELAKGFRKRNPMAACRAHAHRRSACGFWA